MRSSPGLAGFFLGFLILCSSVVRTQGLYPVSTDDKINHSSLIIEGRVVSKKSFWNNSHTMIYTTNQVEVYKVFKGSIQKNLVEIVTLGGTVGNYYIHASHLLQLEKDDLGVFFCQKRSPLRSISSPAEVFEVYSSSQGFIKYDLFSKSAATPFVQYDDIEQTLYNEIKKKTGRNFEIKNSNFSLESSSGKILSNNSTLAPVVSSFSPSTVHAGALMDPANNELTINGSGFGSSPSGSAAVLFSHSDYASGTQFAVIPYNHSLVISWSDSEIKIRVPSQAGTGVFRVRDAAGNMVNSPSNLQVLYSLLNAEFEAPFGLKQMNLGNMNGNGGYSVKYSTSTANSGININTSPAKETFQRALTTWKEAVGVNFEETGTSSLQLVDPDDGENLIMYDNGGTDLDTGPLANGVLATCISGVTICSNSSSNQARKTGFDIVIRNTGYSLGSTPFTLGPCPPYSESSSVVDLESVLLHELGHALNLGHIIDPLQGSGAGTATPSKVMHYSVAYNQRRISLDFSAKAGGEFQVNPHSYTFGTCVIGNPEMIPLTTILEPKDNCPPSFPVSTTPMFSTVNFDLAHTTSNKFVDPAYNQMTLNGTGANITNNAYYAFRTSEDGGDLSLEVLNYSTSPVNVKDCTPGSTGITVSGVKLSIYQVSSCPTAGAFPTPIAYITFQDTGVLPPVSGLSGNTTYLMVVDGIQNTKALFDILFSGSALPVLSTELAGEIVGNYNRLNWTTDPAFGVTEMILERSADGVSFEELKEILGNQQENGEFADMSPFPGANFYRLRVENSNGSVQYSRVVKLNRSENFSLSVYPNPAGPELNIEILSNEPGVYGITLHNSFGQKVMQKQITVNTRKHIEKLTISSFMRGVYYVAAYGKDSKRIKSAVIRLK